ncbi:hypothetical protein EZV62_011820 [Acer yangbiense]|uniref:Amidase domain-containing protein n=1 Tax=Acer yangbiense TaxID=1000413 RepID=A0A5C7I8Z4_9ROSI|nr:hypothetical protein EZV62_011820 [Acer yangbiense]
MEQKKFELEFEFEIITIYLKTLNDFVLEQSRKVETVDEQADSAADGSLQADLFLPDGVEHTRRGPYTSRSGRTRVCAHRLHHLLHRVRHHQRAKSVAGPGKLIKGGEDFTFLEATIDEIQAAFAENKLTSRQLVEFYITQIENLNPRLKSVLEVNPDARNQADEADLARKRRSRDDQGRRSLGKLHGVPVLLKDTIATKDKLNTTAGSYALVGSVVGRDATVVERLRDAGAVILGKASLTEWYSFRSLGKIPNGWCARGGQAQNPYLPSGDPCGSSSGSAISVAANMVAVSLGSETHGSILCPADHNSVVGFKPTVGLTSRAGVIPVLPIHDTIGPISRTVSDAVYLLDLIVGFDPRDYEATSEAAKFIPVGGYKQFLNRDGLKGKRLGVVRNLFNSRNVSTIIPAFEHHLNTLA